MREADITVSDVHLAEMGIDELVELGRDAGIISFEELACRGNGALVQVEVAERYDEDRLDALAYVENWQHIAETDAGHIYVISFTAPALPGQLSEDADNLLGTCSPVLDEDEARMSLVGGQETIAAVIRGYQSAGVDPELERIGAYRGSSDPMHTLTDRQREVIQTAHDLGFYEVPRDVSTADIADALDVDASTVAEHLQRAERNLFNELL